MKTSVAFVIPCHNEEETLPSLLHDLGKLAGRQTLETRLVLIDDGSQDNTRDMLRRLESAGVPGFQGAVRLILHDYRQGQDQALLDGLALAFEDGCDAALTMDADGQHPPETAFAMVDVWRTGKALVIHAVRTMDSSIPRRRTAISRFLDRRLLPEGFPAGTSQLKLLARRPLQHLLETPGRKPLGLRPAAARLPGPHAFVSYRQPQRRAGRSAWSAPRLACLALDALFALSPWPLRQAFRLALGAAALALLSQPRLALAASALALALLARGLENVRRELRKEPPVIARQQGTRSGRAGHLRSAPAHRQSSL